MGWGGNRGERVASGCCGLLESQKWMQDNSKSSTAIRYDKKRGCHRRTLVPDNMTCNTSLTDYRSHDMEKNISSSSRSALCAWLSFRCFCLAELSLLSDMLQKLAAPPTFIILSNQWLKALQ